MLESYVVSTLAYSTMSSKKPGFFAYVLSSTGHMSTQYHSNFLGFSAVKKKIGQRYR